MKTVFGWFLLFLLHSTVYAQSCQTPSGSSGVCKPIRQCQPVVDILGHAPKPTPNYFKAAIRRYQCGGKISGNVPVCCSDEPVLIPPPNLDNHRNRALLPGEKECSQTPWSNRIVGGNKTGVFEFPWMTLIKYETPNGPDYRCGGTVINNKYILTAAHCVVNLGNQKLIGVRVGEHDLEKEVECETDKEGVTKCAPPPQDLGIEQAIPHPKYSGVTRQNDIALIRVAAPYIDLSVDNVFPVCLPFGDFNREFNYDYVLVAGWGATERKRFSPDLLKVQVGVWKNAECRNTYRSKANITYLQLCAGGKDNKDSCGGDSGGPLHSNGRRGEPVQQGVVSFGPVYCGSYGRPVVYTRVVYFLDWILDNIRT